MLTLRHKEAEGGLLRSEHFIWFSFVAPQLAVWIKKNKKCQSLIKSLLFWSNSCGGCCVASWTCSCCELEFYLVIYGPSIIYLQIESLYLCCVTPPNTPYKAEEPSLSASGTAQIHISVLRSSLHSVSG